MTTYTQGGIFRSFKADGTPNTSGLVYTYAAGTLTPLATTVTPGGSNNTNPVVLGVDGAATICLIDGVSYRFVEKTADGTTIKDTNNIVAPSSTYQATGTGSVSRTQASKNADVVSVKDFGAVGDGTTDDTAAIQAALNAAAVVFAPTGVYKISGAITIPSQRRLYGDGMDRTVFRASNAAAAFVNATVNHNLIVLEDFTFDGNNLTSVGITLGVAGSVGTLPSSSSDHFQNVKVAQCTSHGVVMYYCQYALFENCIFTTNGGYGLYLVDCSVIGANACLFTSNKTGLVMGGILIGGADSIFTDCRFYGPYSGAAEGYLILDNCFNLTFQACYFEHEIAHSQPLVRISRSDYPITSNIFFNDCNFVGLSFATDLISISYGRRIKFTNCTAFVPTAGYYILKVTDASATVQIADCYVNTSYSTFTTQYWTENALAISTVATTNLKDSSYQQGTVDLTITDGTHNAAMNAKTCTWVKVGKMVTITGNLSTTAMTGVAGNLNISGLPFQVDAFTAGSVSGASGMAITAGQQISVSANPSTSVLNLWLSSSATGNARMTNANWGAIGAMSFSASYMAAY